MDPLSIAEDEVALEGLDGITLPSLWIRLEDRKPKFPLKLDDCTKELIWRSLISNSDLKFYQLPHEREDVVLFDRFKAIDPETGIETTQMFTVARKEIYPVHIIPENKDGIQGSCVFFKERTDVTKLVCSKSRTPLLNLQEALERYGRKLVVVASQMLRFRTLIGNESDPDLKLIDDSYCLLERVGRARWQGELQRDLHGSSFKIDARKLHYLRKSLIKYGLISMQSHCTRLKSTGQQQHSILLLLKRFHVNRRTKYDLLMEHVSTLLEHSPGQFSTLITIKEHLNVDESSFKRVLQYMRSAKLVEFCQFPLEDLDPSAGPCINKKGNKIKVRCLKLLKPYLRKGAEEDDDEDEDDEDDSGAIRRSLPSQGRIMEKDVLRQAYHIVVSSGTKGIAQSGIGCQMNVGKLEARMLCRRLERDGATKGFMEDEGRQRTTKYISHKCVGDSDRLQMFEKEQERTKLLYSSAPKTSAATPDTPTASRGKNKFKSPPAKKARKAGGRANKDAEEAGQKCRNGADTEGAGGEGATAKKSETNPIQPETPSEQLTPAGNQDQVEEDEPRANPATALCKSGALNEAKNPIVVLKDVSEQKPPKKYKQAYERSHETYRLLRRKNLIVDAVRSFRVIEGLFPLQKIINDEEKQDGVNSKCCRKTIIRLVDSLSREGLLKVYKTTVVQDGITKNVEMVVHPSIQPNDDIVSRVIEQVRFKISSSYAAIRLQHAEEKAKEQAKGSEEEAGWFSKDQKKKGIGQTDDFKPTTVRGLGKSFGFQPKMHRLRLVHNFLWYLIYGHPLRHDSPKSQTQDVKECVEPQTADSALSSLDVTSSGDEEEELKDRATPGPSKSDLTVFTDEDSWKKFIPPVRVHKEFGGGWAMVGDLLLCLPLSIFIQVIQINYKVEGLEDYLNDPVKQHYLVRTLPAKMKRQLLYKRKYIFSFHENLQKLTYMGLMQFGPVEKFKEKDQVFLHLRRNATIVDTTNAEPHYWLVTAPADEAFDRRQYTFNTAEDVENYWFDLMCVCLNTPLGVIRNKRNESDEEMVPPFVQERNVFVGLAYLLKGSREVCDDGSIPGDGKGAGGLHSEFFGHLKRNWLWTNHLLKVKTTPSGLAAKETKIRLKSLLSKNALRIALKAGGSTAPRYVTSKRMQTAETVEVRVEPASRNQQVVGGKKQKRKRSKKEVVKASRKKKKEPRKRTPAHDEADHRALKRMTRQRVIWSLQEDSLMMLCSVAAHLLNSKLKRPFVSHCVVRDLLHAEFEISMDKTSVAVGRRSRYILKNPQTLLNYRICLAEVYQDKPLMKLLEAKKPADLNSPEDCGKSFSEYVRLLRQKFSSVLLSGQDMIMPDTKQQLFSRFKVSAIENANRVSFKDALSCTDDIHAIVLHNLIQSTLAMTNNQMKSSRSFQTFHTYSKYNQELLCQVFIQCRKRGLVNRRRVSQPFGPKKNRALPILPMSYQLSQSYFRCFSWRFPHVLCTDSFRFLRSLTANGASDDRPVTLFHHETENRSENGDEEMLKRTGSGRKKKLSERTEGGKTTAREAEVQPDQANSTKEGGGEEQAEVTNKTAEKKEDSPAGGSGKGETKDKEPPEGVSTTSPGAAEEAPDVTDMLRFSLDSPGGSCVVALSLMSLGLLSVYTSIPKQMVVVDSSLVENDVVKSIAALEEDDDDDEDEGDECDGKKRMEVKAHQASHTNYLIMRGYCFPGIVKMRNLNTNDNIVVESCIMKLQLRKTPAHTLFSGENSLSPPLDLTKCGPSLLPSVLTHSIRCSASSPESVQQCEGHLVQQRGYTAEDVKACAQIRASLDAAGENGLTVHDLHQTLSHLEELQAGRTRTLQQYLKELQEEDQVLQVGGRGVRWVLLQHAEPWLLTVNTKQWCQSRFTSNKLPYLEKQHNIFRRRRTRRDVQHDLEEPPAKRIALDTHEGEDGREVEGLSSEETRKGGHEEEQLEKQKEEAGEERGEKLVDLEEEGGKQMQPDGEREEEAEQEKMETEERQQQEKDPGADSRDGERQEEARTLQTKPAHADNDGDVSFISRPWRMVDGNLNRQVCKGMLEGVLYHIMHRPGITQRSLVEHYKNALQPMAVLDLVQALINIGCVTRKTLVKAPKPSLFSRSGRQTGSEVKVEEPDAVFYEPTISCCLRLSQMLPNERHWNCCIP